MVRALPDLCEPSDGVSGARAATGVPRVRDDPHETVLSQWAGDPTFTSVAAEPLVGRLVVDVHWIEECDEEVDVEQGFHATPPWSSLRGSSRLVVKQGCDLRRGHRSRSLAGWQQRNAVSPGRRFPCRPESLPGEVRQDLTGRAPLRLR